MNYIKAHAISIVKKLGLIYLIIFAASKVWTFVLSLGWLDNYFAAFGPSLLSLAPFGLFLIYVFYFNGTHKGRWWLTASFGAMSVHALVSVIRSVRSIALYMQHSSSISALNMTSILVTFMAFGVGVFLAVDSAREFKLLTASKLLVLIYSAIRLTLLLISTPISFSSLKTFSPTVVSMVFDLILSVIPIIAYLIFWLWAVTKPATQTEE